MKATPTKTPRRKVKLVCHLAQIRADQLITQRELAAWAGTTPATICEAEYGMSLDLATALEISRAVGTPIEEIWSRLKRKSRV